jgi:hypothetical protein
MHRRARSSPGTLAQSGADGAFACRWVQGYFYKTLGNMKYGGDPLNARRFFQMAMEKFEEALDTDPNNPDTLCNCAQVFERLCEQQYNVSNVKFTFDDPNVQVRRAPSRIDKDVSR